MSCGQKLCRASAFMATEQAAHSGHLPTGVLILKVPNRPSLGESSVSSLNGNTRGKKGPGDTMRTLVLTGGHKSPFVPTTSSLQTLACSENSLYSFIPQPLSLASNGTAAPCTATRGRASSVAKKNPELGQLSKQRWAYMTKPRSPHYAVPSAYSLGFPNI